MSDSSEKAWVGVQREKLAEGHTVNRWWGDQWGGAGVESSISLCIGPPHFSSGLVMVCLTELYCFSS